MGEKELTLLLTVARTLRAIRADSHDAYVRDDLWALDEALKPWSADNTVIPLHRDLAQESPLKKIADQLSRGSDNE